MSLTTYQKDTKIEIEVIQLRSRQIEHGMSGSPVLDIEIKK